MTRSLLADAFEHHVWATLCVIDACLALNPEQLATEVPGTYGSLLDTLRHVVNGDSFDLFVTSGVVTPDFADEGLGLPELRAAMERNGAGWARLLGGDLDPDTILREIDPDDGYQRDAPLSIRLTAALEHGSDHRSQACVILTALGQEPPGIDAWHFGLHSGRIVEVWPTS